MLNDGNFQDRQILKSIKKLKSILKFSKYKLLIVGGWDLPEFWYTVFKTKKLKNCMVLESTINESKTTGLSGFIKRVFLSRIYKVFASGSLHLALLKELNFKRNIKITQGVGIINKPIFEHKRVEYGKKFLYVGRLSEIKNLEQIVHIFNGLKSHTLTIIGSGKQKEYLMSIANENISFRGAVANLQLREEFLSHHIFILPSFIEPWGLVVEEALYFGMPVIVSDKCGVSEIVNDKVNGYLINPSNEQEIEKIISSIDDQKYQQLLVGISPISIEIKDSKQVRAYL